MVARTANKVQHGKKRSKRNANRALGISDSQAESRAPAPAPVPVPVPVAVAVGTPKSPSTHVSCRVTFAIDSRVVELSRIEFKLGEL